MPNVTQHTKKIENNKKFTSFISGSASGSSFPGWAVTGIFYTAVHDVEKYLAAKLNKHCYTHKERSSWFTRASDLKGIWREYRELKTKSEDARYRAKKFTSADVTDAQNLLQTIERHLDQLI